MVNDKKSVDAFTLRREKYIYNYNAIDEGQCVLTSLSRNNNKKTEYRL